MTSFVPKIWLRSSQICDDTKRAKKMLLALLHFSWLVYFSFTNHFIITVACRSLQGNGHWNITIAQTINAKLLFEILLLESRVYWRNGKLRRLSGRFHTLIWSPEETVQNLESPRLSGRVDAFVETCFCFFKWFLFYNPLKIQWK